MNTKIKKNLKSTRKKYKNNPRFKNYKKYFNHKQMKYLFVKIYSIFAIDNRNLDKAIELEFDLLLDIENEKKWEENIIKLSNFFDDQFVNLDWKSFGIFLFYIYNISEFYNKKSLINNIYKNNDFVEINHQKRIYYNQWLKSLYDLKINNFNDYVLAVLEIVK